MKLFAHNIQSTLVATLFCLVYSVHGQAQEVKTSQKTVPLEVTIAGKPVTIQQKRWYLENDKVLLGVTDDPGGAAVEFVNKETGTNHVAGTVWSHTVDGKMHKEFYYAWIDYNADGAYDAPEKRIEYQPYKVEFINEENGAKAIKVTGETTEQRLERWHTLRPGSPELLVRIRLTNISDKSRRLWMRWHPFLYPSADKFGDSGAVLAPGEGAQVRKIRVGSGWDHWFRTYDSYWMGADYKSGEGIFTTYEKEKTPVLTTWTNYRPRNPLKGSVTLETFPDAEIKGAGEAIEHSFTYTPFSRSTPVEAIPLGLVATDEERERARAFLRNAKPAERLSMINRYTFAVSEHFNWSHKRRDLFALRDWGFADCAVIAYPLPHVPMKVRMVGGIFDDAVNPKSTLALDTQGAVLTFNVQVINEAGTSVYNNSFSNLLRAGIAGENYLDRVVAVPLQGIPDGRYTVRVEALDLLTRQPIHQHETQVVVFAEKMKSEIQRLAADAGSKNRVVVRPFVAALGKQQAKMENGRAIIPIGVEDGSGIQRRAFPVRLGVPFPKGAFPANAPVRLLSPDGKPVAAEYSVMGQWPDKSLRWLNVAFPADCPANGHAFYNLELGRGVTAVPVTNKLARETADIIEINTGAMLIRVPRRVLSVPGEVFIDSDNNGQFSEEERVLLSSQPDDVWWNGDKNQKYSMRLDGRDSGDVKSGVTLESNNAQSAVVKITGWYSDEAGKQVALGEVRVEAFRGQKHFNLWHQVTYAGNAYRDQVSSYGLKLRAKPNHYQSTLYELDGKAAKVEGGSELLQRTAHVAQLSSNGKPVAGGEQASGAMALQGGNNSMLLHHRDLWQLYPKKLAANLATGEVAVHYWPQEAGTHSFAPIEEFWISSSSSPEAAGTGASRTQEMVLDFSNAVPVEQAAAVYGEPVIACTPPSWVYQTKAIQNLHGFDPQSNPELERTLSLLTDFYENNRNFFEWYGHWNYGTLHNVYAAALYQWLEVGRYMHIGNEEDIAHAPWLMYFRSGDRKYYNFGRLWTRHLMEAQSIRWSETFPEYAGMSRRHNHLSWLSGADYGHSMVDPYLEYYHADGYTPAWEMAKRAATAMAQVEAGQWRYIVNPLQGNIRMYEETGDLEYKKVADRIWTELCYPDRNFWYQYSHGSRMLTWYAPHNEEAMKIWKEWATAGRPVGDTRVLEFQHPDTFGMLGDMTGDERFAHAARTTADGLRSIYTGMITGDNPVYRGMTHGITQTVLGYQRTLPLAAAQIAKSKTIFPAEFLNASGFKEVVIKEEKDADFIIWRNAVTEQEIKITGPDGKPVQFAVELIYARPKDSDSAAYNLYKVTVKADGQTGFYQMPLTSIRYLGSSLKQIALRGINVINSAGGEPLYARSRDLGDGRARILMRNAPGTSLDISTMDGKPVFSKTYVRPAQDAAAIEHTFDLPADQLLRIGDKVGITFLSAKEIHYFINADAVFDLP